MIRQIQIAVSLVANILFNFVIIVWIINFVLGDDSEGCQPPSNGGGPEGCEWSNSLISLPKANFIKSLLFAVEVQGEGGDLDDKEEFKDVGE